MRWALPGAVALAACAGAAPAQDSADPVRVDDFAVPAPDSAGAGIEQLEPDAAPLPSATPAPVRDPTAPAGASTAADSAPRPTPPLTGTDRCDPQQPSAARAECRNILERRAGDFAAPAPSPLSAEQALIASQRVQAGAGSVSDELRSNQELAAIYLARQRQTVEPPKEPARPEIPPGLNTVIEALQRGETTGR